MSFEQVSPLVSFLISSTPNHTPLTCKCLVKRSDQIRLATHNAHTFITLSLEFIALEFRFSSQEK